MVFPEGGLGGNGAAFFFPFSFFCCCCTRISSILVCGHLDWGLRALASFHSATAKMSNVFSKSDLALLSHILKCPKENHGSILKEKDVLWETLEATWKTWKVFCSEALLSVALYFAAPLSLRAASCLHPSHLVYITSLRVSRSPALQKPASSTSVGRASSCPGGWGGSCREVKAWARQAGPPTREPSPRICETVKPQTCPKDLAFSSVWISRIVDRYVYSSS